MNHRALEPPILRRFPLPLPASGLHGRMANAVSGKPRAACL